MIYLVGRLPSTSCPYKMKMNPIVLYGKNLEFLFLDMKGKKLKNRGTE